MLADDDNYRERRYFTGWSKMKKIEEFILPDFIQEVTKQVIKKLAPLLKKSFIIKNYIIGNSTIW